MEITYNEQKILVEALNCLIDKKGQTMASLSLFRKITLEETYDE